jgi:HK97 family phage portal protein
MLFDGNAFTLALPSVYEPAELHILDPRRVEIKDGPTYIVRGSGQSREFTPDNILHTPLPLFIGDSMRGLSPVEAARQGMALSIASERFGAKLFENGTVLSGVIKVPGAMSGPDQDAMRDKWSERYAGVKNAHKPGVLTQGAEWVPLGITPDQAQFLETRRYQAEESARLYGVPPVLIGITTPGAMSYASAEQQNLQFVTYTLRNIVESIEASYQRLIPGADTFLKFNLNGLLRADFKSRMEGYGIAVQNKLATRNEVRAREDWEPISDGGFLETPNNNAPDPRYETVAGLIRAGFDPNAALKAVGLPPITHSGLPPVSVQGATE